MVSVSLAITTFHQEDIMLEERTLDRVMFAETLESSWPERGRRGWTTLTSFGLQAMVAGTLLLLPLLRPTGLPSFHQISTPISLGQPLGDTSIRRARASAGPAATHETGIIFMRSTRPEVSQPTSGDDGPLPGTGSGPYIPGPLGSGDPHGLGFVSGGTQPVLPVAPPATVTPVVRLSHMSEGDLIHKVLPAYPALARSARIQGVVVLQAMIGKQGSIENLRVVTGHPMLTSAAIDAVRQWRYRPYILNNEPVEVETQITVNFSLAGN
jgi:periplasmic protein TonB